MYRKNSPIALALKDAGAVLKRRNKHLIYQLPNKARIVVPCTPSDHRAEKDILLRIKRALR